MTKNEKKEQKTERVHIYKMKGNLCLNSIHFVHYIYVLVYAVTPFLYLFCLEVTIFLGNLLGGKKKE